ncbi:MAG: archaeal proteasome endopeptidase complex subunit alpha [Candidatus Lokiarchaeota archaeon]|nr:archaeal proteasome endopeptidase complex subunit alpha [Candidatus Lokiarchaeota archaeon]
MGYDRAITIFSPDGRLFQVEYAIEAVRRGTTAIGICYKDGVVLVVEKRIMNLQEPASIEKVFKIDEHIGCAIAGLTADARVLIDQARIQCQINLLTYDEAISVKRLTRKICELLQKYTQYAGVRPFGVSLLIAGVDELNGPSIFLTDPSGAYWGYYATAIGSGSQKVKDTLESKYREDLTRNEAINLSLSCLQEVIDEEIDETKAEIAIVDAEDRKFKTISQDQVKSYIDQLKSKED